MGKNKVFVFFQVLIHLNTLKNNGYGDTEAE